MIAMNNPLLRALCVMSLLVIGAGPAGAGDQKEEASGWTRDERISVITGEVMSGTEIRENLRVLCDEIGGRVAGTEAGGEARDFAERLLNSYGLKNVHQESFEMDGWERGPFSCEITSPFPRPMHAIALANTPSTRREGIEAEVVDAGHGNPVELEKLGDEIKGKFALVVAGRMPGGRWMHRSEVMAAVVEAGAAGLLYQTTRPGNLPMTGTCWRGGLSPVPGAGISLEDGEYIRRLLNRGEKVSVRIQMKNLTGRVTSANVIGEIPGRGSEYVIVGAHLDAWDNGQGAVDNGTGTVVIIEAARALSRLGIQPEASIRFILFMAEESGIFGASAYAESHRDELMKCRAMINCDMEGTPLGVRVMAHEEAGPFFEELLASMRGFELTSGVSHRVSIYGDQLPFLLAGVPVVTPISRVEDDAWKWYHTSADTYDKVTFKQLNLDAAFVAAIALELAMTQARIMEQLDEEGVRRLIVDNNLEDALRSWVDLPHDER